MRSIFSILVLVMLSSALSAQRNNVVDLIAASQTSASAIFFKAENINIIQLGKYQNSEELHIRKGLPYFFEKAQKGKPLNVAYIGGSITQAKDQYRN